MTRRHELAGFITSMYFNAHPGLEKKLGDAGKERCHEESVYHLEFLAQAIRSGRIQMFITYIDWARSMLQSRNIPPRTLSDKLGFIRNSCDRLLDRNCAVEAGVYLKAAEKRLQNAAEFPPSELTDLNPLLPYAKKYISLLIEGEKARAFSLIDDLLEKDTSVGDIYEYIFEAAQHEVGRLWQRNVISVAHEHYCSAATQLMMARIKPEICKSEKIGRKLVSCTVSGDLHELGIRMISDLFELEGWDTYYMGADMPADDLIDALNEQNADLLAISVTLPVNLGKAEDLIGKIRTDKNLDSMKIMAGGYSLSVMPGLWKEIGANASAVSAREAVGTAEKMIA